jgi:hypothetical protein
MFWKKKQMVTAAPVSHGATATATPSTVKVEAPPQKIVENPKSEKLSGPRLIPGLVGKYLTTEYKIKPDLVQLLKCTIRRRPQTERASDCRIFDQSEAEAREIQVKNYNSLDAAPDLILYEGWFDEASKHVELTEKRNVNYDVPLFTEAEIQQKIESLKEPGSSVFFYQARGAAAGGPLGRGAAVIDLNPNYPGGKGKKYIVSAAYVIGMEPTTKRQKIFDSNKPQEVAKWVMQGHHKREY